MKSSILTILLFIGTILSVNAEVVAPGTVKGTVIDAQTKQGLGYVTVTVKAKGDTVVSNAGVTDDDGNFVLGGLNNGTYNVVFSYVGYKSITKTIQITDNANSVSMSNVIMGEDTHVLKGVSVVGQQPQMKFDIDKKVFNVSQDVIAAGGSANDVLADIPSVEVDDEGNISLRGNTNVTVWINGKASGLSSENQSQILDQLPAESIDHIEVITNPSAKYSSEGTAGIINIVLKEDRPLGYLGSVRVGAKSNGSANAGTSISYTTDKWDVNVDLGYRYMTRNRKAYSDRTNTQGGSDESKYTFLDENTTTNQYTNGGFLRESLAYHFNKKDQLYENGFGILGHGTGNSTINYDYFSNAVNPIYQSVRGSDPRSNMNGGNATLGYKHEFNKNNTIDFSTAYSDWGIDSNTAYNQTYTNNYKSSSYQKQTNNVGKHELDFQLDYQNKFNADNEIDAGWKSTLSRENSPIKTYAGTTESNSAFEPSLFNRFIYNQDVHAGYFTYTGKLKKLGYEFGLRGEYTDINTKSKAWVNGAEDSGTPYHTNYFNLFPSLYLTYELQDGNEFQVNYSRRIDRPKPGQLNSFKNITDSTDISFGNPELKPQYTNSFEMNYIKNWQQDMLSVSLYYHSTDNVAESINYLDPDDADVMYTTYMNVAKSQSAGLEIVGQTKFFKIINLMTTWNGYYNKLDGFSYDNTNYASQERLAWTAREIASVIFPYEWTFQVNVGYNSRQSIAQGRSAANYYVNLGLKKTFMHKKLTLSANVRDLFDSHANHSYTSGPLFTQDAKSWQKGRIVGLTLTYDFGNMKASKKLQKQQKQDEDEENDDNINVGGYQQ